MKTRLAPASRTTPARATAHHEGAKRIAAAAEDKTPNKDGALPPEKSAVIERWVKEVPNSMAKLDA